MKSNVNAMDDIKYVDELVNRTVKTESGLQDVQNTCLKSITEAMDTLQDLSEGYLSISWTIDDDEGFIEMYEAAVELSTAILTLKSALRKYRNMALGRK